MRRFDEIIARGGLRVNPKEPFNRPFRFVLLVFDAFKLLCRRRRRRCLCDEVDEAAEQAPERYIKKTKGREVIIEVSRNL